MDQWPRVAGRRDSFITALLLRNVDDLLHESRRVATMPVFLCEASAYDSGPVVKYW
jgi:hypothetical protein